MKDFIIKLLFMGLAVYTTTGLLSGVFVSGFLMAIIVAVLIALVNMTVGSALRLVSLPVNILTLGLVGFLITLLVIYIVDILLGSSFQVGGFWNMVLFAIILGLIQMLFGVTVKKL